MLNDNQALPPEIYPAYSGGVYATPPVKPEPKPKIIVPSVVTNGEMPYTFDGEELRVECLISFEHLRYPNGECELAKDPEIVEVRSVTVIAEQPGESRYSRPVKWLDELELTAIRKEKYLGWAKSQLSLRCCKEWLTEAILEHVRG